MGKLDLNVPAESTEVEEEEEESTEVASSIGGSTVSVCSAASDHLHDLKWTTTSGVTTVTGSLDEAVTKATAVADLTVKVGFLSHKVDLTIPVSYSPGFVKGDVKIVAGPATKPSLAKSLIDVDVTGTVKINDASSSEIACLSIAKAVQTEPNVGLVTV